MQYLLMIYADPADEPTPGTAEFDAYIGRYFQLNAELGNNMLGSNALQPADTATMVRVRDGKAITTDGPFAETKEQFGGYYLIEAENLDEALEVAGKIPAAEVGAVEVRPVMVFDT